MFFKRLMTGLIDSNVYILGDNGEAVVIDAGVSAPEIIKVLNDAKLTLKYIILTHAHFDHVAYMDDLRDKTGATVMTHENDAKALTDAFGNGSILFGGKKEFRPADILLKDGDIIEFGNEKI